MRKLLSWVNFKLSYCNWTRTHNHLVCNKIFNHLGQFHWTDECSFMNELIGCRFEYNCSYLKFRFCHSFKQIVHSHSDNYRVWIHSETRMGHDKNRRSNSKLSNSRNETKTSWTIYELSDQTGDWLTKFFTDWFTHWLAQKPTILTTK